MCSLSHMCVDLLTLEGIEVIVERPFWTAVAPLSSNLVSCSAPDHPIFLVTHLVFQFYLPVCLQWQTPKNYCSMNLECVHCHLDFVSFPKSFQLLFPRVSNVPKYFPVEKDIICIVDKESQIKKFRL